MGVGISADSHCPSSTFQHEVRPGLNSRSFVVTGRLQNAAQSFTLLSATLQVTIEDCHITTCEIVGQEDVEISMEIHPNQTRDFSMTISFPTMPKIIGEATLAI